jgi:hypothetical protein
MPIGGDNMEMYYHIRQAGRRKAGPAELLCPRLKSGRPFGSGCPGVSPMSNGTIKPGQCEIRRDGANGSSWEIFSVWKCRPITRAAKTYRTRMSRKNLVRRRRVRKDLCDEKPVETVVRRRSPFSHRTLMMNVLFCLNICSFAAILALPSLQ